MSAEARRGQLDMGEPMPPREDLHYWNGVDPTTIMETTVHPNTMSPIDVLLLPGSLPPPGGNEKKTAYAKRVADLIADTRSRLAQSGAEVRPSASKKISKAVELARWGSTYIPVTVHVSNFGGRPLYIPAGVGIFGMYSRGKRIVGEDLTNLVGTEMTIDGKKGKDWKFVYRKPDSRNDEDANGIAFRISEVERFYIPNDDEPIDFGEIARAGQQDFRGVIRSHYRQLPKNTSVGIWFGTLPAVTLSERVAVELDEEVPPAISLRKKPQIIFPGEGSRHIGARLLHPGSGITRKTDPDGRQSIKVEIDTRNSVQAPGWVIFRPMWANGSSS